MAVTGDPQGWPMKVGVALLDLAAGLQAAIGALAGLLGRERGVTPTGTHASVSLIESGVAALTNVLGHHLATGEEPRRWGIAHPDIVPYQVFAARDGHLVLAVGNDSQFERLLTVLDLPADPRFATNPERLATRDELVPAPRVADRRAWPRRPACCVHGDRRAGRTGESGQRGARCHGCGTRRGVGPGARRYAPGARPHAVRRRPPAAAPGTAEARRAHR